MLISKPNQITNQFELISTIVVPRTTVVSRGRNKRGLISRRGNLALRFWVMSPLAYLAYSAGVWGEFNPQKSGYRPESFNT